MNPNTSEPVKNIQEQPFWGGLLARKSKLPMGFNWRSSWVFGTVAFLAWCASASAQLFVYEGFDYPPDGSKPTSGLAGKSGGQGFSAAWRSTVLPAGVDNFGLTYTKNGVDLLVSGNSAYAQLGTTNWLFAEMRRPTTNASIGVNGITRWFSMLVRLADNPAHKAAPVGQIGWWAGMKMSGSAGWFGRNANKFAWGVEAPVVDSPVALTYGQTVLLVMRVDYLAGQDRTTLWVNPTPALDSSIVAPAEAPDINEALLSEVTSSDLVLSCSCEANLDEIRIGATYYDAVPGTRTKLNRAASKEQSPAAKPVNEFTVWLGIPLIVIALGLGICFAIKSRSRRSGQ